MKKIFLFLILGLFLISSVSAVATLSYKFDSRGMTSDLKYSKFINGGITNSYYRTYTTTDLFDDAPTVNDSIYIYMSAPFDGWEAVNLDTPISSTSHSFAYEYWNGTLWKAVSGLSDGTNNLTQNGQITWTKPTDWETVLANTGASSKSGAYAIFALRIRLVSFSGFTEGGHLTGYQKARQKYISINDGGNYTPASLYAEDLANGWGVITKKGDYAYDISCGVYFGSATFTFDGTKIQIGEAGSPNYVPVRVYGATMLCNDDATYMSDDLASALIIYSKGSGGTITFYPSKNSKLYNLYLAQPYDTHYSRFATGTYGGTGQAQWYNVFIGSKIYTIGSHNFVRMNFQDIQYLLSAGDTIYDSCVFGTRFSKDPRYAPVVTRPTFDGGSSATHDWMTMYYPDSVTRQHHMDVVSGKWTKGNKWKCYADDAYPTSLQRSHIMIYSNYLNVKVQDESGNKLNDTKLSIVDKHGNGALWEDLDVYATAGFTDVNDITLPVTNASSLNAGDVILYWGEILYIQSIASNTLTVSRGNENSSRSFDLKDFYVPLRKRVAEMTINESKDEIYIQERTYYKYTTDGGVTSTGNVYTDYPPLTVKVTKDGYESFEMTIPFNEAEDNIGKSGEVFLTAILKENPEWNYSADLKFMIKNDTNTYLKLDENGNLAIRGELHENTNSSFMTGITNKAYEIPGFLVLTKDGILYLLGELMERMLI